MARTLAVADEAEVRDALAWALAEDRTLELCAGGTKRDLGRPVAADHRLDLSKLAGVVDYGPAELVLKARPATRIAEIESLTRQHGQRLAFEPPDWGPLYGAAPGLSTLGGVLACNLSGPRRISAFAARDHFLGVRAVSGRAEPFKAGGQVVKNVTGYDVCKLLAGSHGTLAVLTEVTVRMSPAPEKTRTVLILGLGEREGVEALGEALRSPYDVSGAAYLPKAIAARSAADYAKDAGAAVAALRIEGVGASTLARAAALRDRLAHFGPTEELHSRNSEVLWAEVRDGALLGQDAILWRVSLPPAAAAGFVAELRATMPSVQAVLDWGGGLVWLALPKDAPDAAAGAVRGALGASGGHATLIRAPDAVRARVPVFQPQPDGLFALARRIKESFDPAGRLNPRRMYADF